MKQVGILRSWCWKKIVILILSEFAQLKPGIKLSNTLSFLNTLDLGGCAVNLHSMLILRRNFWKKHAFYMLRGHSCLLNDLSVGWLKNFQPYLMKG